MTLILQTIKIPNVKCPYCGDIREVDLDCCDEHGESLLQCGECDTYENPSRNGVTMSKNQHWRQKTDAEWKVLDDLSQEIVKQFARASKSKQRELFTQLQECIQKRNALGVKQHVRFQR